MYKKGILEAIGGLIGKVANFDFRTDSKTQGRFAKMAHVKELCPLHPIDLICERGKRQFLLSQERPKSKKWEKSE
ncbi:hypothetical protein Goklo_008212 [Gossypium klotzschianum]|uniref:Uncharacterized protein n=1 Tax=Gossypium klotzschianum TaxID=34286 RepID=A0A7J8UZ13_9ROSI|nr:hypothetical protein [Gossypium klotzschianum]